MSSDACLGMFGDRSAGCDLGVSSGGGWALGAGVSRLGFASSSPSCAWEAGPSPGAWGASLSELRLEQVAQLRLRGQLSWLRWQVSNGGFGSQFRGLRGRSPVAKLTGNSANWDDFWKISGGTLALSRDRMAGLCFP